MQPNCCFYLPHTRVPAGIRVWQSVSLQPWYCIKSCRKKMSNISNLHVYVFHSPSWLSLEIAEWTRIFNIQAWDYLWGTPCFAGAEVLNWVCPTSKGASKNPSSQQNLETWRLFNSMSWKKQIYNHLQDVNHKASRGFFFQMKVTGVEFSTQYLRAWVDLLSKAPLIDKDRLERFCFYRHAQEIGPADGRYGLFFACW